MTFKRDMLLLYAITDRSYVGEKSLYEQVEAALEGGVTMVQLREKTLSEDEFLAEAVAIKELCHKYEVPFIINDNLEVAIKCGADGIHVGIEDMPVSEIRKRVGSEFIIGATAKTEEQAIKAQKEGADYIGVGAVFPSPTKKNAIRISTLDLAFITMSVNIPAVAIGGIDEVNMPELAGGGMAGFAVVSSLFSAKDIREKARVLKQKAMDTVALNHRKMKAVLTIAGSDSCGGAGIQADIKTMTMNKVYAMSAITALTAQNTMGVSAIFEVTPDFLRQQIDAVFEDIYPDAVKIGMVSSAELIEVIAERLTYYKAKNIVVDPVMVATSGSKLMKSEAVVALTEKLLPISDLVTPNISEAEVLSDVKIEDRESMILAAKTISEGFKCDVLLKGGHMIKGFENRADDLLYERDGSYGWFGGYRLEVPDTHGTGCTLSSAIATYLARGDDMKEAIRNAKLYLTHTLENRMELGEGAGVLQHNYLLPRIRPNIK